MGALITVSDLEVINGVARVKDTRLAEALGFVQKQMIRPLIKRHIEALQQFGEVYFMRNKPGSKGGRPSTVYSLNEEQAIYITAKSDTPKAAEITVEMVRVFRDYLKGELKPVKVKAHRRSLPRPELQPDSDLPFGFTLARELYRAIMGANVRVERGLEPDFGKALEGVFADIVTRHYGGDPSWGRVLMGTKTHRERAEWAKPLLGKN
ncbi:Bro-N domain-containing protein [Xanthobacter agilis]|uniref:Uncharacterized protein n=1 Tax=Xanthobacter agilis TaxID=47492 RepID=A0ABU0LJV6_XANAG|nr:Bro-N domain-containing protein [Xanthobacter agilis]MDQ0507421.1 hypothetical protein [Xanthobacter agilis]